MSACKGYDSMTSEEQSQVIEIVYQNLYYALYSLVGL